MDFFKKFLLVVAIASTSCAYGMDDESPYQNYSYDNEDNSDKIFDFSVSNNTKTYLVVRCNSYDVKHYCDKNGNLILDKEKTKRIASVLSFLKINDIKFLSVKYKKKIDQIGVRIWTQEVYKNNKQCAKKLQDNCLYSFREETDFFKKLDNKNLFVDKNNYSMLIISQDDNIMEKLYSIKFVDGKKSDGYFPIIDNFDKSKFEKIEESDQIKLEITCFLSDRENKTIEYRLDGNLWVCKDKMIICNSITKKDGSVVYDLSAWVVAENGDENLVFFLGIKKEICTYIDVRSGKQKNIYIYTYKTFTRYKTI